MYSVPWVVISLTISFSSRLDFISCHSRSTSMTPLIKECTDVPADVVIFTTDFSSDIDLCSCTDVPADVVIFPTDFSSDIDWCSCIDVPADVVIFITGLVSTPYLSSCTDALSSCSRKVAYTLYALFSCPVL